MICRFATPLLCAFALYALALPMQQGYSQQPPQGEQKSPWVEDSDTRSAEEAFKNIQVLKGVPANRMKAVMNTWKNSLGVECTFCHVKGEWDTDKIEEKGYAREMFKMAADLRKNYFDGKEEVTCYTCHRGEKHPAKRLPAAPVERRARPVGE